MKQSAKSNCLTLFCCQLLFGGCPVWAPGEGKLEQRKRNAALLHISAHTLRKTSKKRILDNLDKVFIQRWAWSEICDFSYASNSDTSGPGIAPNSTPFNPDDVFPGSLIFTTAFSIDHFFKEIHPKIKNPYILISLYVGPTLATSDYINDPKIIAWYGNANAEAVKFKKFRMIPIGVNRSLHIYEQRHEINNLFKQLRNQPKKGLLYANFRINAGSTDHRRSTYETLKNKSFCVMSGPKNFENYITETAHFKFAASPLGDMYDCYRHWEALLVGTIPIVQASSLNKIFEGLPVIVVKNYNELTENFLNQQYKKLKHQEYTFEKLYMKYWVDIIHKERDRFLAHFRKQ